MIEGVSSQKKRGGGRRKGKKSNDYLILYKKLLTRDPKDRLGHGEQGIEKLKAHPWFQGLDWHELEAKEAQPPYIPNVNG